MISPKEDKAQNSFSKIIIHFITAELQQEMKQIYQGRGKIQNINRGVGETER